MKKFFNLKKISFTKILGGIVLFSLIQPILNHFVYEYIIESINLVIAIISVLFTKKIMKIINEINYKENLNKTTKNIFEKTQVINACKKIIVKKIINLKKQSDEPIDLSDMIYFNDKHIKKIENNESIIDKNTIKENYIKKNMIDIRDIKEMKKYSAKKQISENSIDVMNEFGELK